jgi:hypothetical protein
MRLYSVTKKEVHTRSADEDFIFFPHGAILAGRYMSLSMSILYWLAVAISISMCIFIMSTFYLDTSASLLVKIGRLLGVMGAAAAGIACAIVLRYFLKIRQDAINVIQSYLQYLKDRDIIVGIEFSQSRQKFDEENDTARSPSMHSAT